MADGELTLKLNDETVRRLEEAATAAGQSVGDYAATLIADRLDGRWAESLAALAEYDRTGVSYSVAEGMAAFDAAMERQLKSKR